MYVDVSIIDAFDAVTSVRSYRGAMPIEDVVLEMEKGKGKQFDPNILDIFLKEKLYDFSKDV